MQSFVEWADVALPRFHKIPLATWGPFSDLHCCSIQQLCWNQPHPASLFTSRPRDAEVLWRLSSDCRKLLALKETISPDLPISPMVFIPLILWSQWLPNLCASPSVCPETRCSPGVLSGAPRALQTCLNCWIHHKLKPGEFCLSVGSSRCLWIFWIRLSVESHVSAKLLEENF